MRDEYLYTYGIRHAAGAGWTCTAGAPDENADTKVYVPRNGMLLPDLEEERFSISSSDNMREALFLPSML
ncbi:MAG: hypothetical protein QXV84_03450 [Conexivisphaerales archaeon]